MRHTYICSLCGAQSITTETPQQPSTCSNRHHFGHHMVQVGDPDGVRRRVLQAMNA